MAVRVDGSRRDPKGRMMSYHEWMGVAIVVLCVLVALLLYRSFR